MVGKKRKGKTGEYNRVDSSEAIMALRWWVTGERYTQLWFSEKKWLNVLVHLYS